MLTSPRFRAILISLLVLPLAGCLFRSHKIERRISNAPLKTATQQELVAWINSEAARITTMNATVDIAADVGGAKKGKVTQYQEIRGYILVRKPEMLRMIGLLPIVRNRAFDMVSDGQEFKLWIPPKNKFYIGNNNETAAVSTNPLENLRPRIIYDALLLHQITGQDQIAVLDNGTQIVTDPKSKKQVDQPDYELLIIQRDQIGWFLSRKFIFDRTTLLPVRQIIYDEKGNIVTDAKYGEFKDYSGVPFPTVIEIKRPEEEYTITIGIVKATINQPLTDEQFTLAQPPGSQLVPIDQNHQGPAHAAGDGDDRK
jgi:outer membrane lipoprotein-sorting protein